MSYMDEYNKLKKKRQEEETKSSTKATTSGGSSYLNEYNRLRDQRTGESLLDSVIRQRVTSSINDKVEQNKSKKEKDEEDKKEERKWFDTSVFDDGFQWSDVPKVVVGTGTDLSKNIWSGILGIGEKVVDAGMTLGAAMNQSSMMQAAQTEMMVDTLSGNKTDGKAILSRYQQTQDEVEKATSEFVAKDLYDEEKIAKKIISDPVKQLTGIDSERDSLLGAKSDSLVQSGGQLLAQIGVNALVPGSGMALMATTAFGSEAEGAFKNGATFDEAVLSSTISAGAEVLTERLGGISFGGKTLTDAAFEGLSRKMTSKIAKALITSGKVATDMTAEGAEEILSGYISAIGQKLTYMDDKEIKEIFSSEDMLESFIGGAVLGGAGGVGGVIQANSKGVDYVTGLTKNEQAVAQKVYESELAEKEKSGKVSTREKNKLYNKVLNDMERGRIDTDTIESVLGGESYEGYKSLSEQETSIKEEIEALENTPESQFTVKQRERLTELREQLNGIDTKTAKSNLFSEVDKLTANDTKLRESYNEKARRGQAFEVDLTQYDTKQQETIKKAVESGILNNTNRTHEFVDLVAKISADKGVIFDFTNNQKLKESGFAIDGKQVNGFVTKDGITVNVNSAKSLDTVVGHEITHVLEGTELYNELQTAIVEYAKSKNDYQGRYDALTKLYENIEGANIDSELTAELVGDYIFTDTDFIHNLSTNHRNVFQKVYDEIKYLYKVATAGSKEARELERVKKLFDEAYRAETKNTADSGVKYSLGQYSDVQKENWKKSKKIVVYENDAQLLQFVQESIANKDAANKMLLGVITGDLAARIKADTGLDFDGKNAVIRAKNVRKILLHDHGDAQAESLRGQLAVTDTDFLAIKDVFGSPDEIRLEPGGYNGKPAATFEKVIGQKKYTMFVVDSGGSLDVFVQTMYIHKNKNGSIANVANANALTSTPTATVGTAPGVNVAQNNPVVNKQFSLSNDSQVEEAPLEQRLSGDDLLDAQDMIAEIENVAEISPNGYVTVYHRTTEENAKRILESGKMSAKEDGIFFSTQKDGEYSSDYGSGVVTLKVPVEKFVLDDIFDTEAHLRIPLKSRKEILDVSAYIANTADNNDVNLSLSEKGIAPTGKFLGKDMTLETAPVAETKAEVVEADVAPAPTTISETETVEDYAPGESLEEQLAKADDSLERLDSETEALFRDLSVQNITEEEFAEKWRDLDNRFTQARQEQERLSAEMTDINNRKYESLDDSDIPPEAEAPYYGDAEAIAPVDPFAGRDMFEVGKRNVKAYMNENPDVKPFFQEAAIGMLHDLHNGTKGERLYNDQVYYESGGENGWMGTKRRTTGDIADLLDNWNYTYDQIEAGLNAIIEGNGKENNAVSKRIEFMLDNRLRNGYKDVDGRPIPADDGYINLLKEKQIDDYRSESFDSFMEIADQYAPPIEDIAPTVDNIAPLKAEPTTDGEQNVLDGFEQTEQEQAPERLTRAKLHSQIVDGIKSEFAKKGLDFDEVLKNAHRMNALSINDNTPQRVNDKTFGYEAGEILNELTANRVALRESNGIKWENEQVGKLRKLSKEYKIKPKSKEAAAVQMYAEGFWVNEKDEIIAYGDAELAKDFPDVQVQNRIKALANDPRIRKIYDETLSAINESRKRNAYPEIPRLENYFLHYRAQTDTFSQLGVPFNPNDIKAKDLPTDINGTTIDRKPGQPFFASSMHREGKRTSFDVFDGLERYIHSAKNQIYHIDDIQTTRALWGYIADRFGQAHGLENLDHMELEAQQEHIQQVYDGHLSNYARFLVEYANNLAGKTALIDRGVEGLIGRRALQFINTVNMQTSRNQVGYSISSPLTNFIPSMEAIARTSKRDSIKAFAQTVSNVFRKDGFVESDPTLIRRRGTDKFAKTLWEKMSDPGFMLMSAVDNVTSEFIVRTKYNELTRKGMDSIRAHVKAGEWASRVMGDRSLGQMPLLYNSKFMGLFTKYQLEVRNALDSQFYDTFQEAKASTKEVEKQKAKNALTATKFAYRAAQIAVLNHVFGMAFEKIAGYNPAFDIVSTIATLFGWDDDEEDEDTFGDNAEQAFKELLGDLPYTSLFTDGGRIPIGSAMPIKQLISGIDKYGNEKSRLETLAEAAPYYLLPGGYSQIKKTTQGLGMFSDEHPVTGSYTDSGNLRFPVEKTFGNVLQAGVFGQYASENARDYFDNERSPLKEKQIQEFIDVDIPIKDYWDYREGLAKLKTNEDKVDYIDSLDLPLSKKNILVNNVLDRKEDVDLADYGEYGSLEEFDFAVKYPEKYQFFEENGITFEDYSNADDDTKDAYNWAYQNPDKYTVSKAIADDVVQYKSYTKGLSEIEADKDENGKSINGSRKEKVFAYIESLPLDYGQKCILFKSQYKAEDSMNMDIIEYLDSREDIDYEEMVTILTELDFTVEGNNVYWD